METKIYQGKNATMFHLKFSLFSQTKSLENKIDFFHDKLLDAGMTFKKAIRIYLAEQKSEEFKKASKQIKQFEHDADNLRRDIEQKLYTQNLIPDLRADVLHIVENLDKVINKFDEVTNQFFVEIPEIPADYHSRMIELCDLVSDCAENMNPIWFPAACAKRSSPPNCRLPINCSSATSLMKLPTSATLPKTLLMNC